MPRRARPRWQRRCATACVLAALAVGGVFWAYGGMLAAPTWESVQQTVERDFPAVNHVSTAQLAAWLEAGDDILLIDCRAAREVEVSRIPGAVHLTSREEVRQYLAGRDRPPARIVAYCSVGWRSSRLADQLADLGPIPLHNLQGSIFTWVNEGRPLVDSRGQPVAKVHPWMRSWGRQLLNPGTY